MVQNSIPKQFILRSSNPNAGITSPYMGFPPGFEKCHKLSPELVYAVQRAHFQTAEMAFQDVGKHPEIYLGDKLFLRVHVDEFGNPGVQTWPEYAIRHPGTVRSLMPSERYPRAQAAPPCQLTDADIRGLYHAAISCGVPFSYAIVRPKFECVGDILVFFPTICAAYGAAACDKLGRCVDPSEFTPEKPFNPTVIHVAMPWLSEQLFNGTHVILVGKGLKKMTVVNGGPYDGGTKKPVTFQLYDSSLPMESTFTTQHDALTEMRNGEVITIGKTTAAGKSEGSSDEADLPDPYTLCWEGSGISILVSLQPETSKLIRPERLIREKRRIISDDISAMTVDHLGRPRGAEIEKVHFYRGDLYTDEHPIPHILACVEGRMKGRIYYYNIGFDPARRRFLPADHSMLNGQKGTNPRESYPAESLEDFIPSSRENTIPINYMVLSVPVPNLPDGWHMPTFLRLKKWDFFAHCCHGARANKGNPALGEKGSGPWAFEGFCGKQGFTLDPESMMLTRDVQFWRSLSEETPCFIVFNGHSMGRKQRFKYSATFLLRALLENWAPEFLNAPLLNVPGTFNGGVPDLRTFLPHGALDERVWNPLVLDQGLLTRDGREFSHFGFVAMNNLRLQTGLSDNTQTLLGDLMRRHIATL